MKYTLYTTVRGPPAVVQRFYAIDLTQEQVKSEIQQRLQKLENVGTISFVVTLQP